MFFRCNITLFLFIANSVGHCMDRSRFVYPLTYKWINLLGFLWLELLCASFHLSFVDLVSLPLGKFLEWNCQANCTLALEPQRSYVIWEHLIPLNWVEEQQPLMLSPLFRAALRMFSALQRKESREFLRCCSQNSPGPKDLEMTFM